MTRRPLPPDLPGICPTCGYQAHRDEPCAWYPCYRCIHRTDAPPMGPGSSLDFPPPPWPRRDDGSHGYTHTEYLTCGCGCHRKWLATYAQYHDTASPIVTTQSVRTRTRAEHNATRTQPATDNLDWT